MGDFEIDILMNRSKGMHITTNGTGEDILKGLAIAAIEVTANIDAKNAKVLRGILCDMIMSAPTRENCLPAKNCKFVRVFARKKGAK